MVLRCEVWQNWSVVGKCPATEGEQMSYIKTIQEAREEIEHLRAFNAKSLTANWETLDGYINVAGQTSEYVVRSYGVEIGRYSDGKVTVHPDAYHHSSTTSKHANIMREAWTWFFERQEKQAEQFMKDHFKVIMVS
jgi:hypothetical protein